MAARELKKIVRPLTNANMSAMADFSPPGTIVWDSEIKGLRARVGPRGVSWQFYNQRRDHGTAVHSFETLGRFPKLNKAGEPITPGMMEAEARKLGSALALRIVSGDAPQSKSAGTKFEAAFEDYCDYLEREAHKLGKPPRWAKNVRQIGKQILLPKWSGWTLNEMSERPEAVEEWHRLAVKKTGPTSANHAARIIRAMYRRRAKRDLSLSKVNIPTAAVEMHKEQREQKGLAVRDFPAWFKAWQGLDSVVHQAYHMVNLLTGARPGELARTRWLDIDTHERTLTIGGAKEQNDITIPFTVEIVAQLRRARDAQANAKAEDLIFAGCNQVGHRSELPARGHALRRTYKTVATDRCRVPEEISEWLMGHMPEGISGRYLLKWARVSGPAIKEAQRKISHEMVALLNKAARKPRAVEIDPLS